MHSFKSYPDDFVLTCAECDRSFDNDEDFDSHIELEHRGEKVIAFTLKILTWLS